MLNRFLDLFPPSMTILFGGLYFIMPIMPEPHLVQKAAMLMNGTALAPIDWFDVVAHFAGGVLAILVWRRERELQAMGGRDNTSPDQDGDQ
ncbi:MAG: hypothetical protein OQK24_11230 [Magnetovibrio sp.]|nr:hypothetical protein [Magnetovibrio sp.]